MIKNSTEQVVINEYTTLINLVSNDKSIVNVQRERKKKEGRLNKLPSPKMLTRVRESSKVKVSAV